MYKTETKYVQAPETKRNLVLLLAELTLWRLVHLVFPASLARGSTIKKPVSNIKATAKSWIFKTNLHSIIPTGYPSPVPQWTQEVPIQLKKSVFVKMLP